MDTPYLSWIGCHTNLHEYMDTYIYKLKDQVTVGRSIYKSTCNNNLGNYPPTSNKWLKIL